MTRSKQKGRPKGQPLFSGRIEHGISKQKQKRDAGEVELKDFDRTIESRFGHMKHADSYILIEETQEKIKEIKGRKASA